MNPGFVGSELSPRDFEGAAGFINASIAVFYGLSGSVIAFGCPGNLVFAQVLSGLVVGPSQWIVSSKEGRDKVAEVLTKAISWSGADLVSSKILERNKLALSNSLQNYSKGIISCGGLQGGVIIGAGASLGLGAIWR
jgi:hypothetical protein